MNTKPRKVVSYNFALRLGHWVTVGNESGKYFVNAIYDDGSFYAHQMNGKEIHDRVENILTIEDLGSTYGKAN